VFQCVAGRLNPLRACPQDILNLWWFLPHSIEFCQEKKMARTTVLQLRRQSIFFVASGTPGGAEHKGHTTPTLLLKKHRKRAQ